MGSVLDIAFHQGDLIVLLRLLIAALAGAVIGWNRFRAGKPAGVGTHALVALGSALFVLIAIQMSPGHSNDAFTRVVQGIATGVGFLGAGEIFRDAGTSSRVTRPYFGCGTLGDGCARDCRRLRLRGRDCLGDRARLACNRSFATLGTSLSLEGSRRALATGTPIASFSLQPNS